MEILWIYKEMIIVLLKILNVIDIIFKYGLYFIHKSILKILSYNIITGFNIYCIFMIIIKQYNTILTTFKILYEYNIN